MRASFQKQASALLDVLALNIHAIIIMHAASVALLLHGVLLASLVGLVIRSNFSAQTLLLIGLLLNIHPRLLSYIQIPSSSVQELSYSVDVIRGFPIIVEEQLQQGTHKSKDYMRVLNQVIANDCLTLRQQSDEENQSLSIRVPIEMPGRKSTNIYLSKENMESESPTKPSFTRCKGRQSTRERGIIDEDKENKLSPLRFVTSEVASPLVSRHNGLRPLTLTNLPLLDTKDAITPKRVATSCSGSKRLSPLFYLSDGRQQHSSPVPSPGEANHRRVSSPPNYSSRSGSGIRISMGDDIKLTTRLEEEMKLSARLRNDLVELRDRACAELCQSKHQAQALAVAVDARERFIKDLAVSVELLRVENKVLKKASRRELCHNVFTRKNINEDVQYSPPRITTGKLVKEKLEVPNTKVQRFGALRSVQAKRVGQYSFKRVGIALRCASGIAENCEENRICRDTSDWFSMGSVSEPTLEPRSSRVQGSPTASTADNAELNECTEPMPEIMDVQFPTISAEFLPSRAGAFDGRTVVHPSSDAVIYQVDGRACAISHEHPCLPWKSHAVGVHMAVTRPRDTPHGSVNDKSSPVCVTSDEASYGDGTSLAMQEDSPFYAVPASTFIPPRVISLSELTKRTGAAHA